MPHVRCWVALVAVVSGCGDNGVCAIREIEGPQAWCTTGPCLPFDLLGVSSATDLALTPTAISWVESRPNGDYILSLPRTGTAPTTLDIVPFFAGSTTHLRAHDTTIGWNRGPQVILQYADATRRTFDAQGTFSDATFAFDDRYVYLPINANTSEAMSVDGTGPSHRWSLGIVDVVATSEGAVIANCRGVWRAPVDGGEPVKLSSGVCAYGLDANERDVIANGYDDQCGAYGAFKIDRDPGEPLQLVLRPELDGAKQQLGAGFAVDEHFAYFSTETGAWRVPLTGGQPRKLADGTIADIAVDETEIYVIADDRLLRIAK